jgi:UDP-N-acetyl-D-glucosamine dehydrogenase
MTGDGKLPLKIFKKKIEDKTARVGVVGLGYVGLPLAMAFAKKGYAVTGLDIDKEKIAKLNAGLSYILDVPSVELKMALKDRCFHATGDYKTLKGLDAVLICVPTPLSKTKEPDISFIIESAEALAGVLKRGQLVVLESTTYPGTTQEVLTPILEKSGLRAGRDFFLAFSPERVDPGNKNFDTVSIPKVVGGVDKNSSAAARALYEAVMQKVVPVSSAKAAEMVKLLENTFRSVNIGLINEIAQMAHHFGVDIWEVVEAAKTKPFGFMPFYPGPGIGGHCLPIDPLYLSWKSRHHGFEAKMIELASDVNQKMPLYVVERIAHLLNTKKTALKKSKILILGAAYKKNIDDIRESPALEVISELLREGAEVSYADPLVPSLEMGGRRLKSQKLTLGFIKKQDCVVVLTDHTALDYSLVVKNAKIILDTRNVLRKFKPKANLFFL